MAQILACLRGWHVPLAQAELMALLPAIKFSQLSPRLLITNQQAVENLAQTLACSSGIQCFLRDAQVVEDAQHNQQALLQKISTVLEKLPVRGSLAVRYLRIAGRIEGISTKSLAGEIGGIAVSNGYSIDLDKPEYEIGLIADGASDTIACGWLVGDFDDSIGTATRRATERPFFRPISLDPRLARLAINLACGPVDDYAALDPMTGTGGFAMEAITMGRNCLALDMDEEMVNGAKQNIAWALQDNEAKSKFQISVGDACNLVDAIPKMWHGKISGVVLDPPYGRNSHGTHGHFELISKTIKSARKITADDAKLVVIIPLKPNKNSAELELLYGEWDAFNKMIVNSGASIIGKWQEHVHASLSRMLIWVKLGVIK